MPARRAAGHLVSRVRFDLKTHHTPFHDKRRLAIRTHTVFHRPHLVSRVSYVHLGAARTTILAVQSFYPAIKCNSFEGIYSPFPYEGVKSDRRSRPRPNSNQVRSEPTSVVVTHRPRMRCPWERGRKVLVSSPLTRGVSRLNGTTRALKPRWKASFALRSTNVVGKDATPTPSREACPIRRTVRGL